MREVDVAVMGKRTARRGGGKGRSRVRAVVLTVVAVLAVGYAAGDNVLLRNGQTLFNVSVADNASTGSRPLRIRFHPSSFAYDPRNHVVSAVSGYAQGYWVADYESTFTEYGKSSAEVYVRQHGWVGYVPPPKRIFTAPTPAPVKTPAPVVREAAVPENVVSPVLPLDERLQKQIQIFVQQQGVISRAVLTSESQGLITHERGIKMKLKYLEVQRGILEKYYPPESEDVKKDRKQWDDEIEYVKAHGRFSFE